MRLAKEFFLQDATDVAVQLLGKVIVRKFEDGTELRLTITETEVYRGEEDLGCHASKGRTPRTEVMYWEGGYIYVYLVYGMYWLLNFVTGPEAHPQAVLVRATDLAGGPGKTGKILKLDKSFYGEDLTSSERLFVDDTGKKNITYSRHPRVGIDYAGPKWSKILWRFKTDY
jgi:DNA-3-methyladenine glycosylase